MLIARNGIRARISRRELELARLLRRAVRPEAGRVIYLGPWPSHGSPPRCTPDLMFRAQRVAVFHDGCYWHECPDHHPGAHGGTVRARDARNNAALTARGWSVLRGWEHDDLTEFAERVIAEVRRRR